MTDKPDRCKGMVSLPELRKGNIGLVVATQIARYVAERQIPGWHSPEQAWAQTQGSLHGTAPWRKRRNETGDRSLNPEISSCFMG